jgi:hypothetical protein
MSSIAIVIGLVVFLSSLFSLARKRKKEEQRRGEEQKDIGMQSSIPAGERSHGLLMDVAKSTVVSVLASVISSHPVLKDLLPPTPSGEHEKAPEKPLNFARERDQVERQRAQEEEDLRRAREERERIARQRTQEEEDLRRAKEERERIARQRAQEEEDLRRTKEERERLNRQRQQRRQSAGGLNGVWRVRWEVGFPAHAYEGVLQMRGYSGVLRVSYFDPLVGQIVTLDETMMLRPSAQGMVLYGQNPRFAGTQTVHPVYAPDNLIVHQHVDGGVTIDMCDNAWICAPVQVEALDDSP